MGTIKKSNEEAPKKSILITGDVAMDKNIFKGIRKSHEVKKFGTVILPTKGGSHLLSEIVSQILLKRIPVIDSLIKNAEKEKDECKDDKKLIKKIDKEIQQLIWIKNDILNLESKNPINCQYGLNLDIFSQNNFPSSLETYATWNLIKDMLVPKPYQKTCGEKTDAWKVTEMIGWGQDQKEEVEKNNTEKSDAKHEKPFSYNNYINQEIENPDILVFDDGGNSFRNDEKAWSDLLYEKTESKVAKVRNISQIILKTAYPLCHGNLFRNLTKDFKNNLTIVTSINEIRKEDVLISTGVSWEQTALDLVSELKNNKSINLLLNCKRLIVNFQSEGALYIETGNNNEIKKCRLIFDPEHLEGDWANTGKIQGDVFGLMSCFTAAVIYGIQDSFAKGNIDDKLNLEATITSGLSAMRKFKIVGHGKNENNPEFPFESICSEIVAPNTQFASAFVPIPDKNQSTSEYLNQNWTILEGNYKPSTDKKPEPLFDTAFRFALFGDNELVNTPFLKINFLTTYDRHEIEALRNIRNLITDYVQEKNSEKPLSLAVFGMPGSGKSFAVKQLAKSMDLPFLEFNLSQFADGELEGAFHQVRDKVLEGKTPVVFWDEFDSQAYNWLQYLLAPMQDGKFQEGQITHPIGKSIFIFAGGTSYTFDTFGIKEPKIPVSDKELDLKNYEIQLRTYNEFILKKGPDFKSRLSGYLNIQGPNQLEKLDELGKIMKDDKGNVVYNEGDIQYPVRRALFIRGICKIKGDKELNIDYGLLNALIETRKYRHGSRSLEKILNYLTSKSSDKLQRSNLPTASILEMMVEQDFISQIDGDKSIEFKSFKIAPQIHRNWVKIGDNGGWKLEYHKEYNYLPAHMKVDNIEAARRIQKVLDSLKPELDLIIIPKDEAEFYEIVDFNKITADVKLMERMAIEEHKGWMKTKQLAGWNYSKDRNDDLKLHPCMLEWESGKSSQLPENEKKKDEIAVSYFAEVLKEAGFVIVINKQI
ncbi:MAG: AAA family ATPase [Bacteroidales bacterium]